MVRGPLLDLPVRPAPVPRARDGAQVRAFIGAALIQHLLMVDVHAVALAHQPLLHHLSPSGVLLDAARLNVRAGVVAFGLFLDLRRRAVRAWVSLTVVPCHCYLVRLLEVIDAVDERLDEGVRKNWQCVTPGFRISALRPIFAVQCFPGSRRPIRRGCWFRRCRPAQSRAPRSVAVGSSHAV